MDQLDKVQPVPQTIWCEQHKKKKAKYVVMVPNKDPIFASKKYLNEIKDKISYFKIHDTFNDWKNVYENFKNDYCSNLNYYCKYIKEQGFNIKADDIDEMVEKLKEIIIYKCDQIKEELKKKLELHQKHYKEKVVTFIDPEQKIKAEYDNFKNCLSTYQSNDEQSKKNLKQSLAAFVKKVVVTQKNDEFKDDKIVQKVDNLRKSQPFYINLNIWDSYQQMIERSLTELQESYITVNSFNQTQIANKGFIFKVFQQIKEDKDFNNEPQKMQHLLTDKLKPLIQSSKLNLLNNLYQFKDDLKNNVIIALIKTSTDQNIGFYYNAKQKGKSLLFNLTKGIFLPVKQGFELKMAEHEIQSPTLTFGQDLQIPNDFLKCSSNLGEAFDLKGQEYKIGNSESYLANGKYFDIEYFELYKIDDQDLLKVINQQHLQPQQPQQPKDPRTTLLGFPTGIPQGLQPPFNPVNFQQK
ncbi:unnamed protein product (macronuclear) [Paramecium tetraurelia]|uniref:TLDc domain-containing protein n=1 Tax=Paramecium tetraurelia TaxID=5888 RepID=A0BV06_PARTE|nr:uncharacterized protein GSPATT00005619001 [Paramecium tetraurelia]CAK62373.1 unnamed protein product [Paramecium tetraurelia]|eukprot:XP_001429771.1 hypothetical protein (macronuclear) [Paramecium tetraurelia strain d4-2]